MLTVEIRHRFPARGPSGRSDRDAAPFELDVAFEANGRVTALSGPSGSGKSSILNVLAGHFRARTARIMLGGEVLADTARGLWVPPHLRGIGIVFQDGHLFPHFSVRNNLAFGTWFRRPAEGANGIPEMARLLGIEHLLDQRPATLSGGERQRVAIGRALLASPRLLLLDEPLASLDAARRETILPVIENVRDTLRVPIVYVSHNMDEVARLADDVVRLENGRVTGIERRG